MITGAWHGYISSFNISGCVLECAATGLVILAMPPVRRYCYEVFFKVHWILLIIIMISAIYHKVVILFYGIVLLIVDIFLRWIIICINNKYTN